MKISFVATVLRSYLMSIMLYFNRTFFYNHFSFAMRTSIFYSFLSISNTNAIFILIKSIRIFEFCHIKESCFIQQKSYSFLSLKNGIISRLHVG